MKKILLAICLMILYLTSCSKIKDNSVFEHAIDTIIPSDNEEDNGLVSNNNALNSKKKSDSELNSYFQNIINLAEDYEVYDVPYAYNQPVEIGKIIDMTKIERIKVIEDNHENEYAVKVFKRLSGYLIDDEAREFLDNYKQKFLNDADLKEDSVFKTIYDDEYEYIILQFDIKTDDNTRKENVNKTDFYVGYSYATLVPHEDNWVADDGHKPTVYKLLVDLSGNVREDFHTTANEIKPLFNIIRYEKVYDDYDIAIRDSINETHFKTDLKEFLKKYDPKSY